MDIFKTNWNKKLYKAAQKNDVAAAQDALDHGADINALIGSREFTPLIGAVISRNAEMVDFLLSKGANPDLRTREDKYSVGKTAMHYLLQRHLKTPLKDIEIAEKLILAGVNLRERDTYGTTIMSVIHNLETAYVERLLAHSKQPIQNVQQLNPKKIDVSGDHYERLSDSELLKTSTSNSGMVLTTIFNFQIGDITRVQVKNGIKVTEQVTKFSDLDSLQSIKPMFEKLIELGGTPDPIHLTPQKRSAQSPPAPKGE